MRCITITTLRSAGTEVDAQDLMFCFTLDSIAEIGFGEEFGSLKATSNIGQTFDQTQVSHHHHISITFRVVVIIIVIMIIVIITVIVIVRIAITMPSR